MNERWLLLTSQGVEFDLRNPQPAQVMVMDIAWSLAQLNRFTGHALRPYSVAEHSLLVCEIAEREFGLDLHGQLAALMHDAHQAYCGDLHAPGQRVIGEAWQAFEERFAQAVRGAFALITPFAVHHEAIAHAGLIALATERRDLMFPHPRPWRVLDGIAPAAWLRLDSPERRAMGWEDWRDRWLDRYHELDFARTEALFPNRPA